MLWEADMRGPDYLQGVDRTTIARESTIGQVRKNPTVLYGIFTELLRNIFSEDIVGDTGPHWHKDAKQTQVWIDQEHVWEDVAPQFRPAIYIALSGLKFGSDVGNVRGLSGLQLNEAEYEYQLRCAGNVTWHHIGNTKGEGLVLAETTCDLIGAFADPIRREFCFDKFRIIGFNPSSVEKEAREVFRSTVTAEFEFQECWTLKLESAKIKRITFDAGQRVLDVISSGA
jgi:hypothetical protein